MAQENAAGNEVRKPRKRRSAEMIAKIILETERGNRAAVVVAKE